MPEPNLGFDTSYQSRNNFKIETFKVAQDEEVQRKMKEYVLMSNKYRIQSHHLKDVDTPKPFKTVDNRQKEDVSPMTKALTEKFGANADHRRRHSIREPI